jgi:hypothetical protein
VIGLSQEAHVDPAAGAHRRRREFEDRTIVVQRVRNLPLAEAERVAFEIVLVEFLNATHSSTPSDRCARCGKPETPDATLLPIGWVRTHGCIPVAGPRGARLAARPPSRRWRAWGSWSRRHRDDARRLRAEAIRAHGPKNTSRHRRALGKTQANATSRPCFADEAGNTIRRTRHAHPVVAQLKGVGLHSRAVANAFALRRERAER